MGARGLASGFVRQHDERPSRVQHAGRAACPRSGCASGRSRHRAADPAGRCRAIRRSTGAASRCAGSLPARSSAPAARRCSARAILVAMRGDTSFPEQPETVAARASSAAGDWRRRAQGRQARRRPARDGGAARRARADVPARRRSRGDPGAALRAAGLQPLADHRRLCDQHPALQSAAPVRRGRAAERALCRTDRRNARCRRHHRQARPRRHRDSRRQGPARATPTSSPRSRRSAPTSQPPGASVPCRSRRS